MDNAKQNGNSPAHPQSEDDWIDPTKPDLGTRRNQGMTKREQFAMVAMQSTSNPHNAYEHKDRAKWATDEADALLAALEASNE